MSHVSLFVCVSHNFMFVSVHLEKQPPLPIFENTFDDQALRHAKGSHSLLWIWLYWPRACKFPILWVLSFLFLGACNLLLSPETICGAGFVKQQEAI